MWNKNTGIKCCRRLSESESLSERERNSKQHIAIAKSIRNFGRVCRKQVLKENQEFNRRRRRHHALTQSKAFVPIIMYAIKCLLFSRYYSLLYLCRSIARVYPSNSTLADCYFFIFFGMPFFSSLLLFKLNTTKMNNGGCVIDSRILCETRLINK